VRQAISGISVADGDAVAPARPSKWCSRTREKTVGEHERSGRQRQLDHRLRTTRLTISGTLAQVNADLSTLTYLDQNAGADSIDVATSDGRGGSEITRSPSASTRPDHEGAGLKRSKRRSEDDAASPLPTGDASSANEIITVTLSDANGALSAAELHQAAADQSSAGTSSSRSPARWPR